jgi:hypothetical protein
MGQMMGSHGCAHALVVSSSKSLAAQMLQCFCLYFLAQLNRSKDEHRSALSHTSVTLHWPAMLHDWGSPCCHYCCSTS